MAERDLAGGVFWLDGDVVIEAPDVQVPAPAPMIEREVIFLGTLADFQAMISAYDERLKRKRSAHGIGGAYIFRLVAPISEEVRVAALQGKISPFALMAGKIKPMRGCVTFAIEPPSFWPYIPDAGMVAHPLPDLRSLVVLWCEPSAWQEVEPIWRDLLGELARLGYIESEPERRSGRGGGPSQQDIRYRAKWVLKWQLAREDEKRLGADPFVAREKPGFSGETLRRYAKDAEVLAYIESNRASLHHSLMSE